MSQDIVADALNQIMNAKKARKENIIIDKSSNLLKKVLDIAKSRGYLDYEIAERKVKIKINEFNEIRAVKPRYTVSVEKIDKYVRRYLPARDFGILIISTNKGLMTHIDAKKNNIGGCIVAYIF